jgi:ribosomal protein S18 acetylase RimI-like enzyme
MSGEMPVLGWRDATPEDIPFLYGLQEETMLAYLVKADPDSEGAWRKNFKFYAQNLKWQIISKEGIPVAGVAVANSWGIAHLEVICVLPEYQNQGVGSEILTELIQRAHSRYRPIRLEVLKVNERAQRFYQRFGFRIVAESRKDLYMVLHPPECPMLWQSWVAQFQHWLRSRQEK